MRNSCRDDTDGARCRPWIGGPEILAGVRWNRPVKVGARRSDPRDRGNAAPTDQVDTGDIDSPTAPVEAPPDRLIALTDGVVAIALTLLVLDLTSIEAHGSSARQLWDTLRNESGRFVAFFIAFWVIAQFWLLHHRVFRRISRHEDTLALRNFWFLFGISLLPFTTVLLGRTTDNPLAVTMFSANLLLISLTLAWLMWTAEQAGIAEPVSEERRLLTRARRITTATLFVAIGGLTWVIPPDTAELLFLLMYLADVPGQLLVRRRKREEPGWPPDSSANS